MLQKKLVVIITHPIQYYSPIFTLLAKEISLKVFYTWGTESINKFDPGFGKVIEWDIPLLEGYQYDFLENVAKKPGSSHFFGIDNPKIINQISAFKPNAILVFGWCYFSHLAVLRYFQGKVPIFFRGDSNLLDRPLSFGVPLVKEQLKKVLLIWIYKHVDYVFYCGKENKKYFKWVGFQENQLFFAPHAIDNQRFIQAKHFSNAKDIRNRFKILESDILVLFAGKLEPKKNPIGLLNAFRKVSNMNIHLLFVGNGILEEQLRHDSSSLPNVYFLPFQNQSNLPNFYYACDLFCLPSKGPGETWGLAVNEAMACGKAVLVSDKVGCASDLVSIGFNGNIFKYNDDEDFCNKLEQLVSNKNLLVKMGNNSKVIIEKWNIEEIAKSIKTNFHLYAI